MDRRRILVADDQPTLRRLVAKHLTARGFEVVEASDGQEALKKVAESRPDLLVLDVLMPGLDGFQVLERLQSVPGTKNIPVVFLTAKAAESDRVQGLSLGAHDYVSKPFSLNELSLRIDRLLQTKDRIERLVDYGQRDEVTGLPRRSYFEVSLKEMVIEHGESLGMVFIVFEGLDDVTSESGLSGVDEAMARAAEVLQRHAIDDTEPFWVGPAHAAVLQGGTSPEKLAELEQHLATELSASLCRGRARPKISVSTSAGMYASGETPEEFVERVTGMPTIQTEADKFDQGSSEKSERARSLMNHPSTSEGSDAEKGSADGNVIRFPTERRAGAK
jgi:CheY-like chemotaxis protein